MTEGGAGPQVVLPRGHADGWGGDVVSLAFYAVLLDYWNRFVSKLNSCGTLKTCSFGECYKCGPHLARF